MSDLSNFDALLHKTHQSPSGTKVPRLMCRSMLSLSKIAHQMWYDTHSAKETGQLKEQWEWGSTKFERGGG